MISCAVSSCTSYCENRNISKDVNFYPFPTNKNLCKKWLKACELTLHDLTQSSRVCSLHFAEQDFVLKDRLLNLKKKQLNKYAVPSKNLNSNNDLELSDRERKAAIRRRKKLVADALAMYETNQYVNFANKTDEEEGETQDSEEQSSDEEEGGISEIGNSKVDQQLEICGIKDEISKDVENLYSRTCSRNVNDNQIDTNDDHQLEVSNSEDDENLYSLDQTCRTCLRNIDDDKMYLPIFDVNLSFNTSPIEVIEEINFPNLKIEPDDGLPQQICSDCMTNLTNINSYKTEYEKNQLILSAYFHNKSKISSTNQIESNSIIKEIEIFHLNEDYRVEKVEKYEIGPRNYKANNSKAGNQDDENSFVNVEDTGSDVDIEHVGSGVQVEDSAKDIEVDDDYDDDIESDDEECIEIPNNDVTIVEDDEGKSLEEIYTIDDPISEKPFICTSCNDTFITKEEKRLHMKKLHSRNSFSNMCPICKEIFKFSADLYVHLNDIHNEEKDKAFKCDICNKGFKTKRFFTKHKARHTTGDFQCPACYRHFRNQALFKYHVLSHNSNKIHKCKFCPKSFKSRQYLLNHERVHTGQRQFKCKICGKAFKQSLDITMHMRLHTGVVKPYQCAICGKNFNQKSTLTSHLKIHTDDRPFKRDECDQAFAEDQQLKYHKYSMHNGPPPIIKENSLGTKDDTSNSTRHCPFCSESFKTFYALHAHIRGHSELRKHPCNECGISFKSPAHLSFHMNRIHLKLRPFSCQYCDRTFPLIGERNTHMKLHNINSSKLSNNENKSLNTKNLNEEQNVSSTTTTQQEPVLVTSGNEPIAEASSVIKQNPHGIKILKIEIIKTSSISSGH